MILKLLKLKTGKWKFGLIFCLLHRAYSICSSQDLFNNEVKNLRIMFSRNGYSFDYFNKVLSNFLSKKDIPKVDKPEPEYAPNFKVPFVGKASSCLNPMQQHVHLFSGAGTEFLLK